ncbi:MAG: glycosyltransferase [Terriglobia bacterium]
MIIPVYNGGDHLDRALTLLGFSEDPPLECIVVDDGSTDDSVAIAKRHGATVLSTEGRCGPARARNIGAEAAKGTILLFIDSDVAVYPETLSKVAAEFAADPELDAVMGSYDEDPSAPNFMSQYRNLMHCFVHQHSNREATTFWTGCGAIRKHVFMEFGGFDVSYHAAAIEDIELGYRMSGGGRKLALSPSIRAKHLKRWSMRSMIKADFLYRALPWAELVLRSGKMPNDLNLRVSQRISVSLVFTLGSLGAYLAVSRGVYFLVPLFVTFFILLSYYWLECSKKDHRVITTLMVILMATIAVLSYISHLKLIFFMVLLCWIALFARHRYTYPLSVWNQRTGIVVGACCLLVIGAVWLLLPLHRLGTVFLIGFTVLVALNTQFYMFLAGQRGKLFALAAIPFHLLYFLSSGLAFMIAVVKSKLGHLKSTEPLPGSAAKAKPPVR